MCSFGRLFHAEHLPYHAPPIPHHGSQPTLLAITHMLRRSMQACRFEPCVFDVARQPREGLRSQCTRTSFFSAWGHARACTASYTKAHLVIKPAILPQQHELAKGCKDARLPDNLAAPRLQHLARRSSNEEQGNETVGGKRNLTTTSCMSSRPTYLQTCASSLRPGGFLQTSLHALPLKSAGSGRGKPLALRLFDES